MFNLVKLISKEVNINKSMKLIMVQKTAFTPDCEENTNFACKSRYLINLQVLSVFSAGKTNWVLQLHYNSVLLFLLIGS